MTPVAFDIAHAAVKGVFCAVQHQFSVHPVLHAEHTVAALHKGEKFEGAHDIVGNGRKFSEGQLPPEAQPLRLYIQQAAMLREHIAANGDPIPVHTESVIGVVHIPGTVIGDDL
jgi:hypothetical protein